MTARPLRICCLATQVADHLIGGMARQTSELATDLARLGHDVTILTTARHDGRERVETEGVIVHYLKDTTPATQSSAWWRASVAAFRDLQRARGFDIVWSQSVAAAAVAKTLRAGDPALVGPRAPGLGLDRILVRRLPGLRARVDPGQPPRRRQHGGR